MMGLPSHDGDEEEYSMCMAPCSPPAPGNLASSDRSSSSSLSSTSSASSASGLCMYTMPLDLLACIASKLGDPALLCLLSRTSRTLRIAASSDSAWSSSFRQIWGSAIHRDTLVSVQDAKLFLPGNNNDHGDGDGDDGDDGNDDEASAIPVSDPGEGSTDSDSDPDGSSSDDVEATRCPAWILAPARCSAEANEALVLWLVIWRRGPCFKVAFGALDRLFSLDFVGDPNGCLARMRGACGGLGEEESRTQASKFAFWASRKGRSEADEAMRARFRRSLSHAITHKSSTLPKEEADCLQAIRYQYVKEFQLRDLTLIQATRQFIARTSMPSEASRVCRIMWEFAGVYREGLGDKDPLSGQSQDVVYLIVWSLLVLNTDTHNPKVRTKMLLGEWVRNTELAIQGVYEREREQGLVESPPVDPAFLQAMFHDVSTMPLVCEMSSRSGRAPRSALRQVADARGRGGLGDVWNMGMSMLRETLSMVGASF